MKYDFLENKNGEKYMATMIENFLEMVLLLYVGLHNHTPFLSVVLGIYMGLVMLFYGFGLLIMIFGTRSIYVEASKKQRISTQGDLLLNGIAFGAFLVWLVFSYVGILHYSNKMLIIIILGHLIFPILVLIVKEIKARIFGYACHAEIVLINNSDYGDYHKIEEYRDIRADLLTVTNVKENPKVFRKLASQYESYIQGYFD